LYLNYKGADFLDASFHYLLMAAHALFQKQVFLRLSGSGLTSGQPKVLDYLGLHDGSRQREIAAGCMMDPATVTGVIGRMEEHGLVERRVKPGDRRSSYVYLTPLGREKLAQVKNVFVQLEHELLRNLPAGQPEALCAGLLALCGEMVDWEELQ
jgi:DNA-binding MarR family transcriptional regulator